MHQRIIRSESVPMKPFPSAMTSLKRKYRAVIELYLLTDYAFHMDYVFYYGYYEINSSTNYSIKCV